MTEDVKTDLAVSAMQDGWSDIHNTPVIVSSVSAKTLQQTRKHQINAHPLPKTMPDIHLYVHVQRPHD